MKKEDYELISEISNSYFPLLDFVNDLDILKQQGKLEECVYQAMQEDLVKIAKLFKYYHDEYFKLGGNWRSDEGVKKWWHQQEK